MLALMNPRATNLLATTALLATSAQEGQAGTQENTAAKQEPAGQQDGEAAPERRLVSIRGGAVKLDVRQWPLIGPPEARYVFVEMFDYACPHCRNTNRAIEHAMEQARRRARHQPPTWKETVLHLVLWTVICEVVGPRFVRHATADWRDALAYLAGALVAMGWWRWQESRDAAARQMAYSNLLSVCRYV